jgi:glutamyl-Q tRNA(Asp) synthetase
LNPTAYRGRFAPSPTGALHFGSLLTAVASYLEARTQQGLWLVRMEDLDPPREIKGAAREILKTLEQFGFEWDGDVIYQSQQDSAYQDALQQLKNKQLTFACNCSRKHLNNTASRSSEGIIYPGTCRHKIDIPPPYTTRIIAPDQTFHFIDQLQGPQKQNLHHSLGDFIIRRRDQLFAYQLAVVVDDHLQSITHIVRGSDLLSSTARQIFLQTMLSYQTPEYTHLPVLTNAEGNKLSKQSHAQALDLTHANLHLYRCLTLLVQSPPTELTNASLHELWQWAFTHWQIKHVPAVAAIDLSQDTNNTIYY